MMICFSHFATLTNAVQLVEFSLQMEDKALMFLMMIAICLISLEVVKLETAKILNLDQNQLLTERSPYPILTGSEERGSKLDHLMNPSSNALLMVGLMVTTSFQSILNLGAVCLNIENLLVLV